MSSVFIFHLFPFLHDCSRFIKFFFGGAVGMDMARNPMCTRYALRKFVGSNRVGFEVCFIDTQSTLYYLHVAFLLVVIIGYDYENVIQLFFISVCHFDT